MSFFKDFKDDLSAAVDELMPGGETGAKAAPKAPKKVDTFAQDSQADLSEMNVLFEKPEPEAQPMTMEFRQEDVAQPQQQQQMSSISYTMTQPQVQPEVQPHEERLPVSDETTVITSGTIIHGDIESIGSLDISGEISGDVKCRGKLTVTGAILGNSTAEEVFADSARIQGEIMSNGTVKIGLGSVIIGNVTANSAVIAGAIKGDIDVRGPVVVDTSAVVMGNIKSRSVQINNGAVIEGFCSQSYAEIDVDSLFGSNK